MNTKLTGIMKRGIIESAGLTAKNLSQMFEKIFQGGGLNEIETAPQRAAERLLLKLAKAKNIRSRDGKELIKSYVKRKFA